MYIVAKGRIEKRNETYEMRFETFKTVTLSENDIDRLIELSKTTLNQLISNIYNMKIKKEKADIFPLNEESTIWLVLFQLEIGE